MSEPNNPYEFGSETRRAVLKSLDIITADCENLGSYPGCDHLTVQEAETLLQNVKMLAQIRTFRKDVLKKAMDAEKLKDMVTTHEVMTSRLE